MQTLQEIYGILECKTVQFGSWRHSRAERNLMILNFFITTLYKTLDCLGMTPWRLVYIHQHFGGFCCYKQDSSTRQTTLLAILKMEAPNSSETLISKSNYLEKTLITALINTQQLIHILHNLTQNSAVRILSHEIYQKLKKWINVVSAPLLLSEKRKL